MDNYQIVILREAQLDIEEIIEWYEEQREGLGESFFARYQHTGALLADNPYFVSGKSSFCPAGTHQSHLLCCLLRSR